MDGWIYGLTQYNTLMNNPTFNTETSYPKDIQFPHPGPWSLKKERMSDGWLDIWFASIMFSWGIAPWQLIPLTRRISCIPPWSLRKRKLFDGLLDILVWRSAEAWLMDHNQKAKINQKPLLHLMTRFFILQKPLIFFYMYIEMAKEHFKHLKLLST